MFAKLFLTVDKNKTAANGENL